MAFEVSPDGSNASITLSSRLIDLGHRCEPYGTSLHSFGGKRCRLGLTETTSLSSYFVCFDRP
jgi:hypothetical protein